MMADQEATFELDFPLGGTVSIELNQFELGHICGLVRDMELSESKLDNQAATDLAEKIAAALKEPRTDPTANLRKAVEEMMNSYRKEAKERKNDAYWRGAADACGNILDMPEMKEQQ